MHAWCAGRLKIVASDTTQPRPSQTFQTRNDFIPNPAPQEPPIATQASTDALSAQPRTATHRGASFNSGASSMATAGAKTQPGPKHHKLAAELADAGLASYNATTHDSPRPAPALRQRNVSAMVRCCVDRVPELVMIMLAYDERSSERYQRMRKVKDSWRFV